jgi:hypothetical protein
MPSGRLSIVKLIEELQATLPMEVRPSSRGSEYLEAVARREDLEQVLPLFTMHLGPAAQRPEHQSGFPEEVRELVDAMGGLRPGQSFYYRKEENRALLFAALWPWESNPGRVTLKVGVALPSETD